MIVTNGQYSNFVITSEAGASEVKISVMRAQGYGTIYTTSVVLDVQAGAATTAEPTPMPTEPLTTTKDPTPSPTTRDPTRDPTPAPTTSTAAPETTETPASSEDPTDAPASSEDP